MTKVIAPRMRVTEGDHFWIKVDGTKFSVAVTQDDGENPKKLNFVDIFESDYFTSDETVVPFIYFADDDNDKVRVHPAP